MDLQIRTMTDGDLDAVAVLFDAYRQFYGQTSDVDAARAFLRERLQARQSMVILVARGDELLGFTQLYPMFSSVRMASIWVLNDLFVAPAARRDGIGRLLLESAATAARAAGAVHVVLETTRDNTPARALYRHAGWHEDETQWYSLDLSTLPVLN